MSNLFEWFLGKFSIDMGIDLGTANTLVCVQGRGIVLNEPSVVAVKKGTNKVLLDGRAVGDTAKEMLGKTPGNIVAIRPLKDGVIADFEITEAMLRYFIHKVHDRTWGVRPRIVIAIPYGITPVEKRAVINSAERAGARKVYLIEEPMAAGIGVGPPDHRAAGLHDLRHRRRHDRGRGDLAGGHRHREARPRRGRRDGRGDRQPHAQHLQHARSASRPPRRSRSASAAPTP